MLIWVRQDGQRNPPKAKWYGLHKHWPNVGAKLPSTCPKHHGHKGNPEVTLGTCGVIGERAQVTLVWVRTQGISNISHSRRLGVTRVKA